MRPQAMRSSSARPRAVVLIATLVAIAAAALGAGAIDDLHPYSAEDPGSESSRAIDRVYDEIGIDPDAGLVALVETPTGADSPAAQDKVERVAKQIFLDPAVGRVTTYYSSGDRAAVALDGRSTYVIANFQRPGDRAQQRSAERLRERLAGIEGVSFGGKAPASAEVKSIVAADIARAELLVFPLLLLLGFWFFRGLVAALLPVAVGAISIAVALFGLRIANEFVPVSVFALNLMLGLGLGLAVDYSMLLISRYREEAASLGYGADAMNRTMATAGRTVLFSALAVLASLATLLVFPQRFIYSLGVGGMLVTILSAIAALVVLPAAVRLLGPRIDALAPPRLQRAAAAVARPAQAGAWYRLARLIMRRPAPVALASAAILIVVGSQFLGARFEAVDTNVLPADAESRVVRETLTDEFPPNPTLPLFAVADARPRDPAAVLLTQRLRALDGIDRVEEPFGVGGGTSLIVAVPAEGPRSPDGEQLVAEIRSLEVGAPFVLGGRAAEFVDQKDGIADRLPLALTLLALTSLVLLFAMTGSVLLSLKGVLFSALTLVAALGALVFIFQDGRLQGLLDYESTGALELAQPLVLLAAGFGIVTDYGVFLLMRIKEGHDEGLDDREAIALGLERTGRIVTATALLVCVAIGAFATSRIVFIKELGLGLAFAVALDATVVRALLVPSVMAMLGRWNWWAPEPLRRLHSRLFARS